MKSDETFLSLILAVAMALALRPAAAREAAARLRPAGSQGSGGGYELTMWLFQDWTVGTAAEIFNTWADEYIAQHPRGEKHHLCGQARHRDRFRLYGGRPVARYVRHSVFWNGKRIVESANILNLQPYYDAADESYKTR